MARASEEKQQGQNAVGGAREEAVEEAAAELDWSAQVEFLRGLAAIVRDEELSELIVEQAGVRLSLRSRRPSIVPPEPARSTVALPLGALAMDVAASAEAGAAPEPAPQPAPQPHEEEAPGTPIVSPMVGSFWRSKSPENPPFVEVGDRVEVGQVIGLIEAMKTFNEILSEVEGEVSAIPAANGDLVEAGTALVVVR